MKQKVPFYRTNGLELFKILVFALIGTISSISIIAVIYQISGEKLPSNIIRVIFIITAFVGFCCGLGWYDKKYSKLRIAGAFIGFLTGLTLVVFFTDFGLFKKCVLVLSVGTLSAGLGYVLVGIDPEAHSE